MLRKQAILGPVLPVIGSGAAAAQQVTVIDVASTFPDSIAMLGDEESASNPNFRRVYDSYQKFRQNYALWQQFSFLQ